MPRAAATYKTHSAGILDVWEDMKEKAEGQLCDLRKVEVNTHRNFEMMVQSLEVQIAADSLGVGDDNSGKASAEEAKASANCWPQCIPHVCMWQAITKSQLLHGKRSSRLLQRPRQCCREQHQAQFPRPTHSLR